MSHDHDIYSTVQEQLHLPLMKGAWCERSKAEEIEQNTVHSQMRMNRVKEMCLQATQTNGMANFLLHLPQRSGVPALCKCGLLVIGDGGFCQPRKVPLLGFKMDSVGMNEPPKVAGINLCFCLGGWFTLLAFLFDAIITESREKCDTAGFGCFRE
jgi:hypothetical protein